MFLKAHLRIRCYCLYLYFVFVVASLLWCLFCRPKVFFRRLGPSKSSYSSTPVPSVVRITRLCVPDDFLESVEETESLLSLIRVCTWWTKRLEWPSFESFSILCFLGRFALPWPRILDKCARLAMKLAKNTDGRFLFKDASALPPPLPNISVGSVWGGWEFNSRKNHRAYLCVSLAVVRP